MNKIIPFLLPIHKKVYAIFVASTLSAAFSIAQNNNTDGEVKWLDASEWSCKQVEQENRLRAKDPDYDKKHAEMEKIIQQGVEKFEQAKLNGNLQPFAQYIIPVVFHVVWNTSAQNISDAQILAQLDQLNKDWSRTSSDTGNTPSVWKPIAANMNIQFCLANKDPNGNPTNGILRKQTTITDFSASGDPQLSSQGGDDPWDVNKYYNIWIANTGNGALGYAFYPPISSYSGAVMNYCTIGSLTTPGTCAPFNRGRTLSHEMGHAFSLYHIWGNDGGSSCTGTDGVSDTPNQAGQSGHTCPSFPKTDACSPSSPGVMFMNHMDYSTDVCYNMFTQGQKARCQSAVSYFMMSLANNAITACGPTSTLDAGISSIITPNGVACNTTFTPVLTLKNYGANTLTSCTINYQIDSGPNQTYNWSGSLATAQTINITLPNMSASAGPHTFTSFTSNPNTSADNNPGNDQLISNFNVSSTFNPPIVEGIENATFPPPNCTINNPDLDMTWARTTVAKKTGSASMWMNNNDYTAPGQADEFITFPLNLSFVQTPSLTFQLAYQMYSNPASYSRSDSLKVFISTDCGVTWTKLYDKGHTALITATPQFSSAQFVPTSNDWRQETISLTPYSSATSALIKFMNITDYENSLYIDDINITGIVGVNELSIDNYISVFPNPSTGIVHINLNAANLGGVNIKAYDLLGETIAEQFENTLSAKTFSFNLADQKNGVYFVEVKTDKGSATKKIIISR